MPSPIRHTPPLRSVCCLRGRPSKRFLCGGRLSDHRSSRAESGCSYPGTTSLSGVSLAPAALHKRTYPIGPLCIGQSASARLSSAVHRPYSWHAGTGLVREHEPRMPWSSCQRVPTWCHKQIGQDRSRCTRYSVRWWWARADTRISSMLGGMPTS